jgi:hypothetical protein
MARFMRLHTPSKGPIFAFRAKIPITKHVHVGADLAAWKDQHHVSPRAERN